MRRTLCLWDSMPPFLYWSFVNYYFHKFLGENPFGFAALDVKGIVYGPLPNDLGGERVPALMAKALNVDPTGDHYLLHDALYQAQLCRAVLACESDVG